MAKTSRRVVVKKGFFQALSEKCSSFAGLLVFCMLVLNFAVVYFFEKSRSPQIVYSVERVFVNTNTVGVASDQKVFSAVASSSSSVSPSDTSPFSSPAFSWYPPPCTNSVVRLSVSYDYFMFGDDRGAVMFGRHYFEGSLTSYGRIWVIFPDRILLEDGSYINNSKWTSPQPQSVAASK